MEASITLKNISKHYNKKYVLSNLTIGIEKGSNFAVIGRNGSGKSTLLRILSTLLKADNGILYIGGKNISEHLAQVKKNVGYLPDYDIHDPWLTGLENLKRRARFMGMNDEKFDKIVIPLIKQFEMDDYVNNYPVTYSHGIKRRLDLIQVLMGDNAILILDEPLLGLDYFMRYKLIKYLLDFKKDKTIILASNEFTEIQTIADRWIVLHNGEIRFDGTLEKMTSQLELPFVANLEIKNTEKIIETLKENKDVMEIRDFGNTIQVVTKDINIFNKIFKKIKSENIVRVSGNSVNIEEFLNQLLSDEGF